MEDSNPIVIDLGSGWTKAGFAGEEAPRVVFPTVVGRPKISGIGQKGIYIGAEALAKGYAVTLKYPIVYPDYLDVEGLAEILKYIFYRQLDISPEEQTVLIATSPLVSTPVLKDVTTILFEVFNVRAAAIVNQASLALAATGRTTGIVLKVGYNFTQAVAVVDGEVQLGSVASGNVAGQQLTGYLLDLLNEKGANLTTTAERASGDAIKEQLCYVAFDYATEMATAAGNGALEQAYELPNGDRVTVGAERFRCPEALFQPALLGMEPVGLHTLLYQAIMKCPAELRAALFANIVLAGGTTLLPGLPERLKKELTALAPAGTNVEIIAPPARNHLAWLGGASSAASSAWQGAWISNEEYQANGPGIAQNKFF